MNERYITAQMQGENAMDRERDRDVTEDLIDDARRQTGYDQPKRRPEQGTDKPGGNEGAGTPED